MNHKIIPACLAFFCLTHAIRAQKLPKGKYAYSGGFTGESLTIKPGNRFVYTSWSCTGGSRGSGRYLLEDNSLYLRFDDTKPETDFLPRVSYQSSTGDSTELCLSVWDQDDKTYVDEDVVFYIIRKQDQQLITGTVSNSRTTCLKIPNTAFPATIRVHCMLTKDVHIPIDSAGKYAIWCPVRSDFLSSYTKGDSLHFLLNKYNRKQIQMRKAESAPGFIVYFRNKNWLQRIVSKKRQGGVVTVTEESL